MNNNNYPTFIIPGLFWLHEADNEYLLPQLKIDNLNQLLVNSSLEVIPNKSIAHWAYNLPTASKTATQILSNQDVSLYSDWLYVEPTHLRVDRDRLLISEPELLQLNEDEIESIINTINNHFADELKLFKYTDDLWLMGCNIDCTGIKFQPIVNIIGENIDDYLPDGNNGLKLHSIMNEVQMLLFNSSINQERKQDGLLEINSIWLWNNDFTNQIEVIKPTQSIAKVLQMNQNKFFYFDNLLYSSQYRDSFAWVNKLNQLDEELFSVLLSTLKSTKKLNLIVPQVDKSFIIQIKSKTIINLFIKQNYTHLINNIAKFYED